MRTIPPHIRSQLVSGMIACGVPATDASNIADVAVHAVEQAIARFDDIIDPLPPDQWTHAYTIGLQLMVGASQGLAAEAYDAAKSLGMEPGQFQVKAGGAA